MQFRSSSVNKATDHEKDSTSTVKPSSARLNNSSNDLKKARPSSKKKTSPVTLLVWAIGLVGTFIGGVNLVHSLKQQGNLPSRLTFSINFGGDNDNESRYSIGSTAAQTKAKAAVIQPSSLKRDQKVGTHFLPPPRNLHGKNSKTTTHATKLSPQAFRDGARNPSQGSTITASTTKIIPDNHQLKVLATQARQTLDSQQKKEAQQKERAKGKVHTLEYFMDLSQREGHDKERLLRLIHNNAGLQFISETTYQELPRWSQVTEMYGTQPKLVGLEQCQVFQQDGDLAEKFLAVAGCFNSGTNLLAKTLTRNCVLHKRQEKYGVKHRGIRWQVPYGKHTPPKDEEFRNSHVAKKSDGVTAKQVLPAVMIRDPFRWLQSMCSHHYTTRWPRVFGQKDARYHCPNLWPTEPEKTKLAKLGREPLVEGNEIVSETATTNETPDTALEAGEAKLESKHGDSDDNEREGERHQSH